MIQNKKEQLKISLNKITRWGLYRQVIMEQIVDSNLKNTQYPHVNQIKEIIKSWCINKQIKNIEELKLWKKKNGFNEDQWNDYITREWRWTKWCMEKFRERIPNYYLERKSMLDKVQYSLIRVSSENLANELYLRIKEKESTFEEIARRYSEGPEKQTQGIVGPDSVGKAHPALAKLLQVSEKGQIWSPRKIDTWWIIVRLNYLQKSSLDEVLFKKLALELGLKFIEELIDNGSYDKLIGSTL